ncbi:hypothetical protein LBMAG42_05670 [Deltaproteobacteria bacterium]|nr:hypothetical protein LBMAG42_05670 [Deltaproteobacteria bacterium]
MPHWLTLLFAPPETPLSPLARYTQANGLFYIATGAVFYLAPGLLSFVPGMAPFVGFEEGMMRALGMVVVFIGWFYFIGGRTNSERFGLATVLDRLLVPVFLLPLVLTGQLQAPLGLTFCVLDPVLGLGAYWIWAKQGKAAPEGSAR